MTKSLSEMSLKELWELFSIQLMPHQAYWEDWYQTEKRSLAAFLPRNVFLAHIGSTAIQGIWVKPIIDILLAAPESEHDLIKTRLLKHGYLCMAQTKHRIDFNKGYLPTGFAKRVFHLHLRCFGDDDELYFRDYLKVHPKVAKKCEQLKLSLWVPYQHDRDGYTAQKTRFVQKVTRTAKAERGENNS